MLAATSRGRIPWLAAAVVAASAGCALSAQDPRTVLVQPGDDLQELVDDASEGTRFLLQPGIYRQQTVHPRNRQELIGQDGVILNGAMELTEWMKQSELWEHEGLPRPLHFHGECDDGGELCQLREDLFVNDRLYERVGSLAELGPGTWFGQDGRAYMVDDPTGKLVELGVTPLAFGGDAEDVVLEDLIVEKYASDAQQGAIFTDDARGWLLSDVTARWNHGAGLTFGPETRVEGGAFSHNGQLGIGGSGGEGSRIEGVEIAFNNYAGYDPGWEAGGTKFWATTGLVVRNSCVHNNGGPGLWTDYDNINTLYEGNRVFANDKEGIKHEISYDATIHDNIVAGNGRRKDNWLWGSQILIQSSGNVHIYGNIVEIPTDFGNGIGIVDQVRGEGAHGPWRSFNNRVERNTLIHLGSHGQNGVVSDEDDESFWKTAENRFEQNSYVVADRGGEYWTWHDEDAAWDNIGDLGFETHGKLIVEQRAPMGLSCD